MRVESKRRPRLEMLARVFPDEYGRRDIVPPPEPIPVNSMPPMTLVLSMNGEKRETTFEEAQEILCGGFPIYREPPDKSEPGNGDGNDKA